MIREAIGTLATVVALIWILAGSAESHPLVCVTVVGLSAWGLS